MEPSVPDGHDDVDITDRQGAGEMDGIGASQPMQTREFACLAFNGRAQLDGPRGAPELLPDLFCLLESLRIEVAVPAGGRESSPNLGVCQPARHSRVAAVPELDGEGGSRLSTTSFTKALESK